MDISKIKVVPYDPDNPKHVKFAKMVELWIKNYQKKEERKKKGKKHGK